jgi:hypothetical protein
MSVVTLVAMLLAPRPRIWHTGGKAIRWGEERLGSLSPFLNNEARGEERGHGDGGPDGEVDFAGREDKDRVESHEGDRRDLRDDRRRVLSAEEALASLIVTPSPLRRLLAELREGSVIGVSPGSIRRRLAVAGNRRLSIRELFASRLDKDRHFQIALVHPNV